MEKTSDFSKLLAYKKQAVSMSALLNLLKKDPELTSLIINLSKKYLNRVVSGCSNCMSDAFMELINLTDDKIMEKDNLLFKVKNGTVLTDIKTRTVTEKTLTAATVNNELPLYHLLTRGAKILKFFTLVPANIEELLEAYAAENKLDFSAELRSEILEGVESLAKANISPKEVIASRRKAKASKNTKSVIDLNAKAGDAATTGTSDPANSGKTGLAITVSEDDLETVSVIKEMLAEGVAEEQIKVDFAEYENIETLIAEAKK